MLDQDIRFLWKLISVRFLWYRISQWWATKKFYLNYSILQLKLFKVLIKLSGSWQSTPLWHLILSFSLLLLRIWVLSACQLWSFWMISLTSSAVSLARSEHHHFCSNVCRCRCSILTLLFCTTLLWSTTFRTNSHSSFDFNFFAFNPWELYTQGYKNIKLTKLKN